MLLLLPAALTTIINFQYPIKIPLPVLIISASLLINQKQKKKSKILNKSTSLKYSFSQLKTQLLMLLYMFRFILYATLKGSSKNVSTIIKDRSSSAHFNILWMPEEKENERVHASARLNTISASYLHPTLSLTHRCVLCMKRVASMSWYEKSMKRMPL